MTNGKEVVVVTGSSGCLGQHIVKLLQEKDDVVGEIRLFDRKPYKNNLGHTEIKNMKHYVADVRDMKSVNEALEGADCVIHAACVIDISLYPNVKDMETTNLDGTKNIIQGCINQNVSRLVFASTSTMVAGSENIFYGSEATTPIPEKNFMLGKYGQTKAEAEALVLAASERLLANGIGKLLTAAIRSVPFYGEEDKHFFYAILKKTKENNGFYRRIRSLDERLQICYVGNAAWAHIICKNRLAEDHTLSGEEFFINDETPIIDIHDHLTPYLKARNFEISSSVFPYWLAWIILHIVVLFTRIVNIFFKYNTDVLTVSQLNYMCATLFFNNSKSILRLDYEPLYDHEEAIENSMKYYSKVAL